jgi:hypothetical protein
MLVAVPEGTPGRSSMLRTILEERADIILDYCEARLDEITADDGSSEEQHMAEVARQSIQALRADLTAPAQSASANLVDQLLRRLFTPIDGKYAYKATFKRVQGLASDVIALSFSFLLILRELATLMPVPEALEEWWPDRGMKLPDTFSRHATAHAVGEPTQVNTVNALIATMLAVSLLCQENASGWAALRAFAWKTAPPDTGS